jgi:hypothetical protein
MVRARSRIRTELREAPHRAALKLCVGTHPPKADSASRCLSERLAYFALNGSNAGKGVRLN